jgi:hypothetical protein
VTMKDFFDRYGPTAAVLVVLTLLVVLMPGNASNDDAGTLSTDTGLAAETGEGDLGTGEAGADSGTAATDAGATVDSGGVNGQPGQTASGNTDAGNNVAVKGPINNAAAAAKGITFGKGGPSCRPDGRQKAISITSPPCAVGYDIGEDNGGATARGVVKDKILVIRYVEQVSPATRAALQAAGATDSPEETARINQVFNKYFNQHYETYGREVILRDFAASGPPSNEEAMRSDVIKIADELKAFAVYWGTANSAFAEEASARKLICICTAHQTRDFHKKNPYVLSALPVLEEHYDHIAEYWGKRLAGKPAKFAGGAEQNQPRKFGLVWQEGSEGRVNPFAKPARDYFIRELAKYGVELASDVGYIYDLTRSNEMSQTIIAKMKSAGVNHIAFIGEPLTPVALTAAATRNAYFPEWFISGTLLIDTTFFGRTYDQQQWSHAFGISPLWVFWENLTEAQGYREYHHGKPGSPKGEEGVATNVIRTPHAIFFAGVQMAGPNLTPDTFRLGLYSIPSFGGTPSVPKIGFSPDSPTAVDDFTEVWWDPNGTGKDETDKQGKGRLMKTDGGKRYDRGEWTRQDSNVFDASKSVYTTDNPPGGHHSGHDNDGHRHPAEQKCYSCAR